MKPFLICICLVAGLGDVFSQTIAGWYFNSRWPDGDVSTGTTEPSTGWGYAMVDGEVAWSFATGDTAVGRDPAGSIDNSAWATSKYPGATNGNKSAGVRFQASTEGYSQIKVMWQQRNSSTASRFTRFQYALDGVNFVDGPVIVIGAGSVFIPCAVDLSGVAGVGNNPAFAFRLVTEWERTATGSGYDGYVATAEGATYSTSGTMRFDVVTVAGTLMPGGNNAPVITGIGPQTIRVWQWGEAVGFTVLDGEDPAGLLMLSAESSNELVVPAGEIVFGGSGPNRTVRVKGGAEPGVATVVVRVMDLGGKTAWTSFVVTVLPLNCEPVIGPIPVTNVLANESVTVPFTVGDLESGADALGVQVYSSNAVLVTSSGMMLGGSGSNRWLRVTPVAGQAGVVPIGVRVSDGSKTAMAVFALVVRPANDVLVYDPFAYGDGSLRTNSAGLWWCHSGIEGQTEIRNGEVGLFATNTEDLAITLPGGPYVVSNRTVLYASFRVALGALPRRGTGPFVHFGNGNSMMGRLYVSSTNAAPGFFRMLISNGGGTPVELNQDFETNRYWRVVMRYDVDGGVASFWVNPRYEHDRDAWGTDGIEVARVTYFGMRQGSDIGGDMVIDDVRVGLSFVAVTSTGVAGGVRLLSAERVGGDLVLRWGDPAGVLQYGYSAGGPFYDLGGGSPRTQGMGGLGRFFRVRY